MNSKPKLNGLANLIRRTFRLLKVANKIETIDDLNSFLKKNSDEYSTLYSKRENLWKKYHRAKTDEDKSKILDEINDIQPKIKELRKFKKYCEDIKERSVSMQNNIDNFDKDLNKEKEIDQSK